MHPLLQQLQLVGRRAHRLLVWRAAALWICVVLAVLLIAGYADFWFRYAEVELRWIASGLVACVAAFAGFKLVWPAIRFRGNEQLIAQWVERRFPDLQDRLSSAVTFVANPHDDLRYGSPVLRQAVVQEASAAVASKDLLECLDSRPFRQAALVLLATTIVVVLVYVADVQSATIAMRRIVMPWRNDVWPRRTWLVVSKAPSRIAAGQDFVVEVLDRRGWLPSDAQIQYWFDGDIEDDARSHPMTYAGGKMTHRLPQVTRGFRYRAVGGDDHDMEWARLEVVEEPRVTDLKIELTPPAYTGLSPSTSERTIRGFVDTDVRISGRTSRPVRSVEMHFDSGKGVARIPTVLGGDRMQFELHDDKSPVWRLSLSGKYGWVLVDDQEVANQLRLDGEIEVLKDVPPTVTFESPTAETPFTANAVVKVRLAVRDDLAVQKVVLDVAGNEMVIDQRDMPPAIDNSASWPPAGEQRSIEYPLDLRDLPDLQPGQTLALRVTASDFRPQPSALAEMKISIISGDELKSRLDQRQSALLQRVSEALRLQRALHSQLQTVRDESSGGPPAEVLPGLELGQQRVRDYLGGDQGALRLAEQLLAELDSNRVDDPELRLHLATIETQLRGLVSDRLPPIEWQLGQATKQSRLQMEQNIDAADSTDEFSSAVAAALKGQDQAIETLEEIVDRLAQWSGYRLLAQDVAQFIFEQEKLVSESRALSNIARNVLELSEPERAKLRQLGSRQTELAARVDRLHQRLERMRRQLGTGDEVAAATMDAAIELLRQLGITAGMRDAARQLTQNRVGSAENLQTEALAGLTQLHNVLSHRVEQDPARILEQLGSVGEQIDHLRKEQSEAAEKAAAAEQQTANQRQTALGEFANDERRLIDELQKVEQQLRNLPAKDASRLLRAAAENMDAAKVSAERGDAAQASRLAELANQQLAEASKQLARDQRKAEQTQSNEQLQWLMKAMPAIVAAEQALRDQTSKLAKDLSDKSELDPDQRQQSETLSRQQRDLADQVTDAKARIGDETAFSYALQRAAELMEVASKRLAEHAADPQTVELQDQAIRHLERLLTALADNQPPATKPVETGNESESEKPESANEGRKSLAELRLLRMWQQEINDRTDALNEAQGENKSLTADQQRELAELIEEQRKLAQLIEQFDE